MKKIVYEWLSVHRISTSSNGLFLASIIVPKKVNADEVSIPEKIREILPDFTSQLTAGQKRALERIYKQIDMDNDGFVTLSEVALFNQQMCSGVQITEALNDAR